MTATSAVVNSPMRSVIHSWVLLFRLWEEIRVGAHNFVDDGFLVVRRQLLRLTQSLLGSHRI